MSVAGLYRITSARRFEKKGYIYTVLLMRALRFSYRLGLPYRFLEKLYLNADSRC